MTYARDFLHACDRIGYAVLHPLAIGRWLARELSILRWTDWLVALSVGGFVFCLGLIAAGIGT